MSQNQPTATASATAGGLGLGSLLTVLFVALKLTHLIDWAWWWVLAPIWIPVSILVVAGVVLIAVAIVSTVRSR